MKTNWRRTKKVKPKKFKYAPVLKPSRAIESETLYDRHKTKEELRDVADSYNEGRDE